MTQLEIQREALTHNVTTLTSKLAPGVRFIAVVKANAYGHGAVACVQHLQSLGVKHFAVAYTDEGIALRKAGVQDPIMVFYPEPHRFADIVTHQLSPAIYSKQTWDNVLEHIALQTPPFPIHLKFNTGLNRIGFSPSELEWIFSESQHKNVRVVSVYSHLGGTEEAQPDAQVAQQLTVFESIQQRFKQHPHRPWFHLLNTSGVFHYPNHQLDAVRCGIGLYGYANAPAWDAQLQPVGHLTTSIVQIHHLQPGEYVGYNKGWQATTESRIATLPLGHADGIQRGFGHAKLQVWVQGQPAAVVGNICMDMLMIDVTHVACSPGDSVVLFNASHPLSEWAAAAGTIPYEVLAGLGPRVSRVWR